MVSSGGLGQQRLLHSSEFNAATQKWVRLSRLSRLDPTLTKYHLFDQVKSAE